MKAFRIAALILALAVCAGISHAQTALTYTTTTQAISGGSPFSGLSTTPTLTTTFTVTSLTGITGGLGTINPVQTLLVIDREVMAVVSTTTATLQVTVVRGWNSTQVSPHVSGSIVIAGPPNGFQQTDPAGNCLASGTLFTPWVTIGSTPQASTGRQWICDATTKDWHPVLSTGAITPVATAAAIGTTAQTFTVNGVITGEPISILVQPAPTSLCPLVAVTVSATNTVSLWFSTLTAAACTPAAGTYEFLAPLHY